MGEKDVGIIQDQKEPSVSVFECVLSLITAALFDTQ